MYGTLMIAGPGRLLRRVCASLFIVAMLVSCDGPARTTSQPEAAPTEQVDPRVMGAEIDDRVTAHFSNSAAGAFDNVRAVLVTVGGERVVERYFHSSTEPGENVLSVTKSVMSILIGIALDDGVIQSVDETLENLLPKYADDMAGSSKRVTLRHVLTMTAGFPPDLGAVDFAPGAWGTTKDWTRTILADGRADPS